MEELKNKGMKLGDRVWCFAYVRPTGNHYEIHNGLSDSTRLDDALKRTGSIYCVFWVGGADVGEEVDGFHECDRFYTVEKEFTGVFVGTTTRNTRLMAEYDEPPYGPDGYYTRCYQPEKFAIVYYAENKKRLVPLDKIEVLR